MKVEIYPKNKKQFIKLKKFVKQILKICEKINVKPIAYGGLVYFAYTKDKETRVNDIDFLVSEKKFPQIMEILDKKRIKYNYLKKYGVIQVLKRKLKVELDSMEGWQKNLPKQFKQINFNGLIVKAISLKSLKHIYKEASKFSKDKPEQHRKRFEALNNLK